jgi:hypothetical protein
MQENFLHFLWRWRRFASENLVTTEGEPLEIIHPGDWNQDAGPDFFAARVRVGDQLWGGNVEIHLRSSDWRAHGHATNPAYENVVLHVVLEDDRPVFRGISETDRIPTLVLKGRIPAKIEENWQQLLAEASALPCRKRLAEVPQIIKLNWLDRLLVERLEQKTTSISEGLSRTEGHWEQVFFEKIAYNFGLKINADSFENVAKTLTINHLAKSKDNLLQLEALLFGQAGLLETDFVDDYPNALKREYHFLKHKYQLVPLEGSAMKFLRLRPPNFPTIRLAQLAWLIHHSLHLFSKIQNAKNLRELENLFHAEVSDYWQTHYVFDKISAKRQKTFGRDAIHLLLINTVAPFLFIFGKKTNQLDLAERATRMLEEMPAESNAVIEQFHNAGLSARNAYQSQAILQLSKHYCAQKKCLECAIGCFLLK